MSDYRFIRYDARDGIAEIVLDRPPLNLVHEEMTREYLAALDAAESLMARANQGGIERVLV